MWRVMPRRGLWLGWWSLVAAIALFSLYGRPLLRLLREVLALSSIGTLLTLVLLTGLTLVVIVVHRLGSREALIHLLWLLPLVWGLSVALPIVEERLHLILFGSLGMLALPLFGLLRGILMGSAIALLDEGLQWYLPERVGDWGDVVLNVFSLVAGVALAHWLAILRQAPARREVVVEESGSWPNNLLSPPDHTAKTRRADEPAPER